MIGSKLLNLIVDNLPDHHLGTQVQLLLQRDASATAKKDFVQTNPRHHHHQ